MWTRCAIGKECIEAETSQLLKAIIFLARAFDSLRQDGRIEAECEPVADGAIALAIQIGLKALRHPREIRPQRCQERIALRDRRKGLAGLRLEDLQVLGGFLR